VEFEVIGPITATTQIAGGRSPRQRRRLRRDYGDGTWTKRRGIARVRLPDGTIRLAEVHWYEAHGIGRKELKVKRLIDWP
jgi:hypothetical protein